MIPALLLACSLRLASPRACMYDESKELMNLRHEFQSQSTCTPCIHTCTVCSSSSDLSCMTGNCERGYFYNSTIQECIACQPLCQQCQNTTQCHQCIDSYYFNTANAQCEPCLQGALTCTYSSTLACKMGYYYDSKSYVCKRCLNNCQKCSERQQCQQCQIGYRAEEITTSNGVIRRCLPCQVQNCARCESNRSLCSECQTAYNMYSDNYCSQAQCGVTNCLLCHKSQSICELCQQQYILIAGKCYFGASLLCGSAENNTDYGSCVSCRQSDLIETELADKTASYCVPKLPVDKSIFISYSAFIDNVMCISPYLTSTQPSSQFIHSIDIAPSHSLSIEFSVIMLDNDDLIANNLIQVTIPQLSISVINSSYSPSSLISHSLHCPQLNNHNYKIGVITKHLKITDILNYNKYSVSSNMIAIHVVFTANGGDLIGLKEIVMVAEKCMNAYCVVCLSPESCSKCQEPYFIQDDQCVIDCGVGYNTNKQTRSCELRCQTNFYTDRLQSQCLKCPFQCSQCEGGNPISCLSCADGYYLQSHISDNQSIVRKCVQKCLSDQLYENNETKLCEKCLSPCKTCQTSHNGQSKCTSCTNGYLYGDSCVIQCPAGYYASSSMSFLNNLLTSVLLCSPCAVQCATCLLNRTNCLSCTSGRFLFDGECRIECPSGHYQDVASKECAMCVNPCQECVGASPHNCTSCSLGYLTVYTGTNAGKCVNKCPQTGYFLNRTSDLADSGAASWGLCQICTDPNCRRCDIMTINGVSEQGCLECWDVDQETGQSIVFENHECVNQCSNGWADGGYCQQCSYPCKQCKGQSDCSMCQSGYSLLLNTDRNMTVSTYICVLRCPSGTYSSSSSVVQCVFCPDNCIECLNDTYCLACNSSSHHLHLHSCVPGSACPSQTYYQSAANRCQPCSDNCKSCKQSPIYCLSCSDHMYLQRLDDVNKSHCVPECRKGLYESAQTCEMCQPQCHTCQIISSNCSSCSPRLYLMEEGQSSKCIGYSDCAEKLTHYPSNAEMQCLRCHSPCLECSTQFMCFKCQQNWYLMDNQCLGKCPQGFYDSDLTCLACDTSCETCSKTAKQCITCTQGYYLSPINERSPNNSVCQPACPSTYFAEPSTLSCEPCKYPCIECQQLLLCTVCQSSLVQHNSQCLQACPNRHFRQSADSQVCSPCPSGCQNCQLVQEVICSQCSIGYFFLTANNSSQCGLSCPSNYYPDDFKHECMPCKPPCLDCSQQFQCLSCVSGYSINGNSCYALCPVGTYGSDASYLQCLSCDSLCVHCTSATSCLICRQNTHMYVDDQAETAVCLSSCPSSHFTNSDNICKPCSANCLSCLTTSTHCLSCKADLRLQDSECVRECEQFYHLAIGQSGQFCQQCSDLCLQCKETNQCIRCFSSYLVITNTQPQIYGHCAYECPASTFKNTEQFVCEQCQEGCLQCLSQLSCALCDQQDGYTLLNVKCIKLPCPTYTYHYEELNTCVGDCWQLGLLVYEQATMCISNTSGSCANYGLVQRGQYCLDSCPNGEHVGQQLTCIKGTSDNYFTVEAFRQVNGTVTLLIRFTTAIRRGIPIQQQWYQLFIDGVSAEVRNSNSSMVSAKTLQRLTTQVSYIKTQLEDAIVLEVVFPEISKETTQTTNDIELTVQISQPYSPKIVFASASSKERLLQNEGTPLQNKKYSLVLYNTIIQQKSAATEFLSLLLTVSALIFSLIFIAKTRQRVYLLFQVWDFLQLLYLLNYVSLQWPAFASNYFNYFAIAQFRWLTFNGRNSFNINKIDPSPEKYYSNSYDLNIFHNTIMNLLVIVLLALLICISRLSQRVKRIQNPFFRKIFNNSQSIIMATLFITYINIHLYSCINLFSTPEIGDKQYIVESVLGILVSVILSIALVCVFLLLAYKQGQKSQFLDPGINPLKKKIVTLLPIYLLIRKIVIVLFLTIYPHNSAYAICFGLIFTISLLIMITWYEPFISKRRYKATILAQFSLLVFLLLVFVYILNPQIQWFFSVVVVVMSLWVFCINLAYPGWYLYKYWKTSKCEETELIELNNAKSTKIDDDRKQTKTDEISSHYKNTQFSDSEVHKASRKKINFSKKIAQNLPIHIERSKYIEHPIDRQADVSNQEDDEKSKNDKENEILRLAKRNAKKYQQFKNYDVEEGYEIDNEQFLIQKQAELEQIICETRRIQETKLQQNKTKKVYHQNENKNAKNSQASQQCPQQAD